MTHAGFMGVTEGSADAEHALACLTRACKSHMIKLAIWEAVIGFCDIVLAGT